MTLTDPEKEYSPCPWCGQPGRLLTRVYDDYMIVQTGCRNEDCLVNPRTKSIYVLIDRNFEEKKRVAIQESIKRWEESDERKSIRS